MRNSLLLSLLLILGLSLTTAACGGKQRRADAQQAGQAALVGSAELVLVNESAEPIFFIQMSPSADPGWGEDLLGEEVLLVGQSFRITGLARGMWDIRVVDSSGNKKEMYRQEIGANGTYTLTIDSYGWGR